ncbi:MAG: hypothetical protein MUF01_11410 [Bryobacterales bacterium]|jgi:hypothetical protein|nr:hypothetical protein [Bryobacterales bacterium]
MSLPTDPAHPAHEDPPPFLGTWSRVYAAVGVYLALLILLFALFRGVFEQ